MTEIRRRGVLVGVATVALISTGGLSVEAETAASEPERNKRRIAEFVDVVWRHGQLDRLGDFWTSDCVNHADPSPSHAGLAALRLYHEQFGRSFTGFEHMTIEILQQVAENDRVVTQLVTRATHTPTGKAVSLATIRIDRLAGGKIAEHWSVADMAGLMHQLAA